MQTIIENVNIKGISTCVPNRRVDIFDNKKIYGGNIKKLKKVVEGTGFQKRCILKKNSKTTAGDLALFAAQKLIEETNTKKNEIGAVIMVTQYPDYFEPANACVIHGKLGLEEECLAFDINQGCAGYIYGLFAASKLINKNLKKALLLVGDTASKMTGTLEDSENEMPIHGDGCCASLIEYDENAAPMYFDLGTKGEDFDSIIIKNGGFKNPPKQDMFKQDGTFNYNNQMDGLKVFDFTMNIVPKSINNVLKFANIKDEDVDYYVFHQANKMIMANIGVSAEINQDKILTNTLSEYGNLSSASVPSVISDNFKIFDKKENKILMTAFGVGLSWGSTLVTLKNTVCLPIIFFEEISRDEE